MNVEDQLTGAMRRSVETIDAPVAALVDGGVARGRHRRLRHRVGAASAVAAVVVTVAAVTTGAMAGPPLYDRPRCDWRARRRC